MKKVYKNMFIFAPVVILFLMIAFFVISPILNNITLKNFAKQLDRCTLPMETKLIESKAVCGKLNGNGNGMDFFACILVKSDLSLEELRQYYISKSFKPAKIISDNEVNVDVLYSEGYKLKSEYVEHQAIYFDSLKNEKEYSGFYIVMIYDGGYDAGFDLRGH